ncbi:Hypothetical protein R9X50_00050100 [Acrodontium crateriforme]|uniref:Uncharacterized protein n=1 Tax=Acrodontium crateriforme TaxID=150365 RepID=A0AAQ3R6Z7_9PEZI|nr:Hypothetical protein R9X50_00050100 [Acrodontium crateriforme]
MVRKSARLSSSAQKPSGHKRAASNTATPTAAAKRSKVKATLTKSPHFKDAKSKVAQEQGDFDNEDQDEPSSDGGEASEFEGKGDSSSELAADEEDDYESESDAKPARKRTSAKESNSDTTPAIVAKDAWRPGVSAGLGPGKQLIIKKVKPRPAGETPYTDTTIHPNTFLFLKDLKANNQREWLKMHDAEFRQSEQDWYSMVETLTEKLTEIDDTVPELPVKDLIFRIYRDIRFSKDPTPYKPHFSAAWSRTGRKGPYAVYYVHIEPNDKSFVGGGLWHPEASSVASLRRDIDRRAHRIKNVLMNDDVRKTFLDDAATEAKAVSAFCKANASNALKSKPKGYDGDHPNITLLRLRNFVLAQNLTDDVVVGPDGMKRILELMTCMKPFITYLNSVVMPDEADEEDNSDDDDMSNEEDDSNSEDGA